MKLGKRLKGRKHRKAAGLAGHDVRVVRAPCGRYGVPDVMRYEIREGEHAGKLVDVPPRWQDYPAPMPDKVEGWARSGRDNETRTHLTVEGVGAAYRRIVHDEARFAELDAIGWWLGREHMGDNTFTDNRSTA